MWVAPVLRCAVVGCDTVENNGKDGQVFSFPAACDVRRPRWLEATSRAPPWTPSRDDGLCTLHFRKNETMPTKYLYYDEPIADEKLWDVEYLEKVSGVLWTSPLLAELQDPALPSHIDNARRVKNEDNTYYLKLWNRLLQDIDPEKKQSEVQRVAKLLGEDAEGFLGRLKTYHRLLAHVKLTRAKFHLPKWVRILAAAKELPPADSGAGAARGGAGAQWERLAAKVWAGGALHGAWGALWAAAERLARARLALLASVGDDGGALAPAARPAWAIEDVVMLQAGDEERVALPPAAPRHMERLALCSLFELVQQYDLEGEHTPVTEGRWAAALTAYRARHRAASLVLLQRRWYELKRAVHVAPHSPALHSDVAARYPRLLHDPPPSWEGMRATGTVFSGTVPDQTNPSTAPSPFPLLPPPLVAVLPEQKQSDRDSDNDDVVLIERKIDTLEISDDEDRQPPVSSTPPPPSSPRSPSRPPSSPLPILISDVKSEADLKLTFTPVVILRELTSVEGWNIRDGRYVSLNELKQVDLLPSASVSDPNPIRPIASRLVFEEDDLETILSSNSIGQAIEISFDEDEEGEREETRSESDSRKVRLPDIEQVRRRQASALTAQVSPSVEGEGEGEERGKGETVLCCWALRDRAANAARVRTWAAGGRAPPLLRLPFHELHCRPPCGCCCRGAQWGWAGAPLAFRQEALDRRLEALIHPGRVEPSPAPHRRKKNRHRRPAVCPPTKKHKSTSTASSTVSRKRRAPPPPPSPPRDPLQEWIRQRNINNRFFDLNLRPPPQKPAETTDSTTETTASSVETTEVSGVTIDTDNPTVKTTDSTASTVETDDPTAKATNTTPEVTPTGGTSGYTTVCTSKTKEKPDNTPPVILGPTMIVSDDEDFPAPEKHPTPPPNPVPAPTPAPRKDRTLSAPRPPRVAPVSIVTLTHPPGHKSSNTPMLVIRPLSTKPVKYISPAPLPRPPRPPVPALLPAPRPASASASVPTPVTVPASSPRVCPPLPGLLRAPAPKPSCVSIPTAITVKRIVTFTSAPTNVAAPVSVSASIKDPAANTGTASTSPSSVSPPTSFSPTTASSLPPATPTPLPLTTPTPLPPATSTMLSPATPASLPLATPVSLPPATPVSLTPATPTLLPPANPTSLPPATPASLPPATPTSLPPTTPTPLPPATPTMLSRPTPTSLPPATTAPVPSAKPVPSPVISCNRWVAVSCDDQPPFEEPTLQASQISWAGRPLVVGVSGLAPWGPLLGWYLVSGRRPAVLAEPVEWYVVARGALCRVAGRPPDRVQAVWGVQSAAEGARLARGGAPLLALHAPSVRALRVAVREVRCALWGEGRGEGPGGRGRGAALTVRCACALFTKKLAAAFNAADSDTDYITLDDD